MIEGVIPLRRAGFALHWLHPRTKRPIGEGWSSAPVASVDELRASWREGNNVGVRLGEPSKVAGGYLHALDIDIRDADAAEEAFEALADLLGEIKPDSLPMVASGSGGASRHLYFISDKPFYSRKLWISEGKHRGADGKWHYDAEIELFGTGKQCVVPPSIHPDTRKPYTWVRPFDFDLIDLGIAPIIPAARLREIADPETSTYEFETIEPLTFKKGQLERELGEISDDRIDDYHDWVTLGQALHHQFGGSREGYDLWVEQSKRSEKFDPRGLPSKWRGFGRSRRRPVTMATIRQWVIEQRHEAILGAFDDLPEVGESTDAQADSKGTETRSKPPVTGDALGDNFDDLLGGSPEPEDPLDRDEPADDTDPLDRDVEAEPLTWAQLLDLNDEGAIRPSLHNVSMLIENDPRVVGIPSLNEFTQETVQRSPVGTKADHRRNAVKKAIQLRDRIWQVDDPLNGTLWSDDRDMDVRRVFEAPKTQGGYGIKVSDRDLRAAIVVAANKNTFHPVREYLSSVEWDGVERVETMFVDYLGAEDNSYIRDISRLLLLGAVTRIYEPGHKFDFAVIIEGLQGKGKSTFIQILGKQWFAELDGDFHDSKQMIELMQGAWIMEIPELSGFTRADVRAVKAFISRQKDRARLAYARRAGSFPRQCVFIGSTNDSEYLKDDSGGRRFWPVYCTSEIIDFAAFSANVDQIWAEAVQIYREMRAKQPKGTLPLYLSDEHSKAIATKLQESRRVESADDGLVGQIAAWLEKPIMSGGFDDDDGKPRDITCLLEVWCECMGGQKTSYGQMQAQMLGRAMQRVGGWDKGEREYFDQYGRQRAYSRVGAASRHERVLGAFGDGDE